MSIGGWPSGRDYVAAVQDPSSFGPADLQEASVREGMFGMPASASGQNAIVFSLETPTGSEALRCFTRQPADSVRHRYRLLDQHLEEDPATPLARASWHERGVRAGGGWWPVVRMPWLPGTTLDLAVEERLDDPGAMRELAEDMRALVRRLVASRVAHGDLQHGNVLVTDDGTLNLVDYDSVWLPGTESMPPDEIGHRNYQHPERRRSGAWGPGVDTFSALVIHVSLLALAAEPELWDELHRGENLVVVEEDLDDPGSSSALERLRRSPDQEVVRLVGVLETCCRAPLRALGTLETLIAGQEPGSLAARTRVDLEAPGASPWWVAEGLDATVDDRGWSQVQAGWVHTPTEDEWEWSEEPVKRRRRWPWSRR